MPFTAAELAAMREADAEIEAAFCMTSDDYRLSAAIEQATRLERHDIGAPL